MDVGTAKPSIEEQKFVRHHMLDLVDPNDSFTAARYKELAHPIVASLTEQGLHPIVCGGTGFYFRNLLEGLVIPAVEPQIALREELRLFAEERGNAALHRRLEELDPLSATRISMNDKVRVIRALEVTICTGKPFSYLTTKQNPIFDVIWIGLFCEDKSYLAKLIRERLAHQFSSGFLEEARHLYDLWGPVQALINTVGYAEIIRYLNSEIDLQEASDLIELHTNQLARKQLTWFRSNKKIHWLAIDQISFEDIVAKTSQLIHEYTPQN
jgi:tRNA dimethylallyltransferase